MSTCECDRLGQGQWKETWGLAEGWRPSHKYLVWVGEKQTVLLLLLLLSRVPMIPYISMAF